MTLKKQKNKILLIAYYYPPVPIGSGGIRRTLELKHYLPENDYEPLVLSTATFGDNPDPNVYQAKELRDFYLRLIYKPTIENNMQNKQIIYTPPSKPTFKQKIARSISAWLQDWILIPDKEIGWLPFAYFKALEIIKREKVKIIYSTSPPEVPHLIALALHITTGLPWVADFRDGWIFEPTKISLLNNTYRHTLESLMERLVIKYAEHIITTSPLSREYFLKQYSFLKEKQVSVIYNGYDPQDYTLEAFSKDKRASEFMLVHTGNFSYSHLEIDIRSFIKAIERLSDDIPEFANHCRIMLLGNLSPDEQEWIKETHISELFTYLGSQNRSQVLKYQAQAQVLFLILPKSKTGTIQSKLLEYIAAGRPILAMIPEGVSAEIIRKYKCGLVVEPDDVDGIVKALKKLYEDYQQNKLFCNPIAKETECFNRRNLIKQFATIFDSLLSK